MILWKKALQRSRALFAKLVVRSKASAMSATHFGRIGPTSTILGTTEWHDELHDRYVAKDTENTFLGELKAYTSPAEVNQGLSIRRGHHTPGKTLSCSEVDTVHVLLLLRQYTWGKMPELSTQYLFSSSHRALYRVGPRRRTSQDLIMWDGVVPENRMLERWAELTGCSIQVGDNHGLQKIHLNPYSNTNTACQRLRFTFSPLITRSGDISSLL